MSYPNYPSNRLIVNGIDLTTRFGLIMADGYTLSPPSPKTYEIDIPGGNGKLDLTETLLGDAAYNNRTQEFTFYVLFTSSFERVKTQVSTFLHGKAFDYQITMDPNYIYHGRFTISNYEHGKYTEGIVGCIKVSIDAEPFKRKSPVVLQANAIGGVELELESGRQSVVPVFQTSGSATVIYEGKEYTLSRGTWKLNDIVLKSGVNTLYLNTFQVRTLKWGDLLSSHITWNTFSQKQIFKWYKSQGDSNPVIQVWEDVSDKVWAAFANTTWGDQVYRPEDTSMIEDVHIKYDWGDL